LFVLHHGEVVVDRAWGTHPDVPFLLFSAGKPLIAVLTHRLAARKVLALDDPVARYWPEFSAYGKDRITLRQVLQHRSGLPHARGLLRDALAAPGWERSVRALATARPAHEPGAAPAYHTLSYGFLLGEVIQRATGRPLRDVLRRELLEPLGLGHTHLGTPPDQWRRRVPLRGVPGPRQFLFNRRGLREAVIPAASVSAPARDLGRFYQALLDGAALDDLASAVAPSSEGEIDRVFGRTVRWAAGFHLGGVDDPARVSPFGRLSSPRTFGHNGSNVCLGWADPDRNLVVAYVTNRLSRRAGASPHLAALSDALITAADAVRP
jgi:CubicO group peptidase (beta-lactamase class C family)